MSKKSNRLKARLRIEAERAPKILREAQQLADTIRLERARIEKTKALSILVDNLSSYDFQRSNMYRVCVDFYPELLMIRRFNGPVNMSGIAASVAYDAAEKIKAVILEKCGAMK